MKKILYVDMDNVLVDFNSGILALSDELKAMYVGRFHETPGIFSLMKPMPDAIDAFCELAELFDTYILSTGPWENPSAWSDKVIWVKQNIGKPAYKRLILTHHKNLNDGAFLIDDHTKHGVKDFGGEHIHFGCDRFPDWKSVMNYLRMQT